MFVVINVDDLGLNPAVRRAVEKLGASGAVTSSTVMANGPDVEKAAEVKSVGLGAHLNILRGTPLSDPSEIPSLVGKDGNFVGSYVKLLGRYVTGRLKHAEVELEWSRQIEKLKGLGIELTHFDSEKHIHAWPTLMMIATKLAKANNIKWVRRPVECSSLARLDTGALRTAVLNTCGLFQRKQEGVRWPDSLWGIADQGAELLPERFEEFVKENGPFDVIEICCHPGFPLEGDPQIPGSFGNLRVGKQWMAEYEALLAPEWKTVFARLGAEVVSYGQIP